MDYLNLPRRSAQTANGENANPVLIKEVLGDFVKNRHREAVAAQTPFIHARKTFGTVAAVGGS